MKAFVFCVCFIIFFAGLVASVPSGLLGAGSDPDELTPIDPSIISGYADNENFSGKSGFYVTGVGYDYAYSALLGGYEWIFGTVGDITSFRLGSKVLYFGVLWLGTLSYVEFVSPSGENHGVNLLLTDLDSDADDGTVTYKLYDVNNGVSMGGFSFYWNTTAYTDAEDAWDNNELYFLHGVGFSESATSNVGSLLVSLLLLQIPEIPLLLNLLIVTPVWASIIYVLWFVIKEMIPFV